MSKHEAPPFRMIIERGRLIPATPYDAERLDTYRNGMEVRVRLTEDQDRIMLRKWWAILGRAIKECKTPWKTKEQASEAIKLAIGVVKYGKTVAGDFMTYPKSLTELDDPELTAAVEQMIDVVYHITGVDPAEWKKGVAHIREPEPSSPSTPAPEDATAEPSSPPGSAAPDTRAAGLEADGIGARAEPDAPSASEPDMVNTAGSNVGPLKAEMVKKLLQLAGDDKLTAQERLGNLDSIKPAWIDKMPGFPVIVDQCFATAGKIIRGELKPDAARKFMEGIV